MSVKTFKLNNGEEIIANVLSETKEYYEISYPAVFIPTGEKTGNLMPWLFTSHVGGGEKLQKTNIMLTVSTDPDIKKSYISGFSIQGANEVEEESLILTASQPESLILTPTSSKRIITQS